MSKDGSLRKAKLEYTNKVARPLKRLVLSSLPNMHLPNSVLNLSKISIYNTYPMNVTGPVRLLKCNRKNKKFRSSKILTPCRCFVERLYDGENSDFEQSDKVNISNPLKRLEQLGTRWFGLIIDLDCLLVEAGNMDSQDAWLKLAQKRKLRYPSNYDLKVAERSNPTQFITQVMFWGTDRYFVRDLITEYHLLKKSSAPKTCTDLKPGVHNLLRMLTSQDIPCIITSSESRQDLRAILVSLGIHIYFDVEDEDNFPKLYKKSVEEKIVGSDDTANGLPDPELYAYAANLIQRSCNRCVVLGASLSCCEAAHSLGMKCILVQGDKTRRWEMTGADVVKNSLEEIFFQDFKELFSSDLDQRI